MSGDNMSGDEQMPSKSVEVQRRATTDAGSLNILLNPESELAQIENSLRGGYYQTYYNHENSQWETKFTRTGKDLLNEEGVQNVMSMATSVINKNVVLGNLTEDEIAQVMENFHASLASMLMRGYEKFNIQTINDYHTIINIVTNFARIFLSRTKDGIDRDLITQTQSTRETVQTGDDGKKRSFFGI